MTSCDAVYWQQCHGASCSHVMLFANSSATVPHVLMCMLFADSSAMEPHVLMCMLFADCSDMAPHVLMCMLFAGSFVAHAATLQTFQLLFLHFIILMFLFLQ